MTGGEAPVRAATGAGTYALLTDGTTVLIRAARPADTEAVRAMHAAMSPDNLYLRFFSLSPRNAETEASRVCREPGPDHAALLAWLGDRLVGVASYEPVSERGTAEVAFAVPDDMHGRGIATLLLEHLVSVGRERGLHAFTAEALVENQAMLTVFADAGLPVHRKMADGVIELTFPIPSGDDDRTLDSYLDSVAARESQADVASLRHLLRPTSVAVVGASRRRGTVGREILHNIVVGGFAGAVYPVNPRASSLEGLHCLASVEELPERVDLAVLAVPAAAVVDVAAQCGRRGVRSLVVITSGLAPTARTCSRYAAGTACAWSAPTASAWQFPSSGSMPPSPPRARRLATRGWSSSPAGSGSRCWSTCRSWASACPRSPRSATSTTCRATTC